MQTARLASEVNIGISKTIPQIMVWVYSPGYPMGSFFQTTTSSITQHFALDNLDSVLFEAEPDHGTVNKFHLRRQLMARPLFTSTNCDNPDGSLLLATQYLQYAADPRKVAPGEFVQFLRLAWLTWGGAWALVRSNFTTIVASGWLPDVARSFLFVTTAAELVQVTNVFTPAKRGLLNIGNQFKLGKLTEVTSYQSNFFAHENQQTPGLS
ncbi:hypothetical protein BV898_09593 [Hypsibius exemplaris]|uniref:Uncharacterized protein n=1 Tax=Hypsibius exemplaris TaxID=2072580 RepID=A0A1W0WM57_HYPEX|nr:hypothetical protein BV898_09593 [Hypsibius exemplaris]